ncbi:MAG TPA: alpha-glucan family phosphorylase [Gammaproteobacteria bacterium]|nr:alpha-glucan family phosphorylase [Gammaproteobacteria bacterium]
MFDIDEFIHELHIAYFSMEIALRNEIPTYAGGLGILAGDTIRSAADLELPMVTVSLASREGYFRQVIDSEGQQHEQSERWDPGRWCTPLDARVSVPIEGHRVWVGGWFYVLEGHMGGRQPVILLDTDLNENGATDRKITHFLYGDDLTYRFKQEIVLGIGGARMLRALGFTVRHYHMNEGHSALLTLQLLRRYGYAAADLRPGESRYDIPRVRELCNFTTHTPVEAGHDRFSYDMVERILGEFVDPLILRQLAGSDNLNMTRLALNLSEFVNGVAKRHAETSRQMFPGYRVRAVTNGVHPFTWATSSFRDLYDAHLAGWCHEPELLIRAECCISDEAIWTAHVAAKEALRLKVSEYCDPGLDPDVLTLGFARRMTAYKRPDLLFTDVARLKAIAKQQPFQVVLAGKAHPQDETGKQLIKLLHTHMRELADVIRIVYLPNYDMALAAIMVAGVDVWLNTPQRPLEASGTSGMKAAFNGVPNLSVLDGWWVEGCIEGITGWAIGDGTDGSMQTEADSLYHKLEQVVLPLYYQDRAGWIAVMKGAIAKNASFFNSHRMMRRYVSDAYVH